MLSAFSLSFKLNVAAGINGKAAKEKYIYLTDKLAYNGYVRAPKLDSPTPVHKQEV
jgi:hypothetical protein